MCRTFGLRKYSRVPGGGMSRRSSRYDFSMATPATGITPNPMSVVANTAFNSSGSNARFLPSHPSNGNIRFNNGGTNSIKCVAIVTNDKISTNSNSSSNAIVMLPFRDSVIHREEPLIVQNSDVIDNKVLEDKVCGRPTKKGELETKWLHTFAKLRLTSASYGLKVWRHF